MGKGDLTYPEKVAEEDEAKILKKVLAEFTVEESENKWLGQAWEKKRTEFQVVGTAQEKHEG